MTVGRGSAAARARAYAVHLYTASGIVLGFFAAAEIVSETPDLRAIFLLFIGTVVIDATDGPLARRWEVKRFAARIDGRTIDDIVDYITYTFLPLLLVWRMGWLPDPAPVWALPALIASLFGFANTSAKDEKGGFFLGFPSYWNVVALYAGILYHLFGPWINAAMLLALAALTLAPIGFVYPNLAPRPWKAPVLVGAVVWLGILLAMLADYPRPPEWLFWLSLVYPALYTALSWHLRRRGPSAA
ncbi:MAG: phosphatidylcholine synthase [Gemmatimonadetes bacterium]|nr:phosphatidylcholine synthase [Gemmatimonadota bacterium]